MTTRKWRYGRKALVTGTHTVRHLSAKVFTASKEEAAKRNMTWSDYVENALWQQLLRDGAVIYEDAP